MNWNTSAPGRPALKAIAAILQEQTSAIVTTKASGLSRPRDLDGKVYASYAARFEGRIVQKMIMADGGRGDFEESTPPMLGIFDTILAGKADATWVFMGWEGVIAARAGVELNSFYPQVYCPSCLSEVFSTLQTLRRARLDFSSEKSDHERFY